ncbi:MAG: hypothetical protein GEV09_20620 [Pseudonocardiaceae bacterium]|nr:hypothetical protein [Pseudonocardiaceae bacterium]
MTARPEAPSLHQLRVDCIGSFLRPAGLKQAYRHHAAGAIDDAALARAQDDAIADLVAEEEAHGLPVVTDGEFRRAVFMESFSDVAGMDRWKSRWADKIKTLEEEQRSETATGRKGVNPVLAGNEPVTQRLQLRANGPRAEYEYLQGLTRLPGKASLINPDRILQSVDLDASSSIYPEITDLLADVVRMEREMVAGLREAGCRYVHIDAPGYTAYVDADSLAAMRARGDDPDALLERAIAADNEVIAAFGDLTFGIHICRGNRHSQWHREGAYDAIAERLFSELDHDRLLLEYDDERSGDFTPLRYVPHGKTVVLGLVTTKRSELESRDCLLRRIDDATQYIDIDQLAISPQCGFASDMGGNVISEQAQWRKIELVCDIATEVWGR